MTSQQSSRDSSERSKLESRQNAWRTEQRSSHKVESHVLPRRVLGLLTRECLIKTNFLTFFSSHQLILERSKMTKILSHPDYFFVEKQRAAYGFELIADS